MTSKLLTAGSVAPFDHVLTWLIQSTVLLAVGLLAGRLLKGRGPAVRSALYRAILAAVLICPIASMAIAAMGFPGLVIRLPGAAVIFTAATTGIPLCLTHHLRHNRVLHERVLFIATVSVDAPRVEPAERVKLVPVGAGITRVIFYFGFMETPNVMEGLKLACLEPALRGIDPENITYYFRRVMVIASDKTPGMAVWRKSLFATMHLNANLPAAYFGVPTAQVVEVGLEVEI